MPTVSAAREAKTFKANRVHSRIALSVGVTAGRSRREHVYEDGALRVRFPNGDDLEAMIVNTAGGMAGGDRLSFEAHVGEGAALTVTTAAAEKVYRSLGDDTAVDVRLKVDSGGSLRWLPQETILFDAARLRRTIDIEIAADAALVMAEGVIFGRAAMDEQMRQGSLFDRWRFRRDGHLVFADTTHFAGDITSAARAPGDGTRGYRHSDSLHRARQRRARCGGARAGLCR